MKLLRLELEGVRGVPDGGYSFSDPRTGAPLDVVIVTGASGSGKTSLLETIAAAKEAVGHYGDPPDPRRLLRRGGGCGSIQATWLLSEDERARSALDGLEHTTRWELVTGSTRAHVNPALRRLFSAYSRDPAHGKVEYVPANRSLLGPPGLLPSEAAEARLRLGKEAAKYVPLLLRVRALARQDASQLVDAVKVRGMVLRKDAPDSLGPFRAALAALLPDVRLGQVDLEEGGVRFARRDRVSVEVADLSESERQGVLFALAFWGLGLAHSVVLLDEPELHIHAADRVRFLQAIVGLGRDNQLIVATGSTEIIGAAARGQVIDLSARAGTLTPSIP